MRGRIVQADASDQQRLAVKRPHVGRDVRRAAEPELFALESHHRHRRLRRDAIDPANQKVIEHHVADDGDPGA